MGLAKDGYVEELGQANDDGVIGRRSVVNHLLAIPKDGTQPPKPPEENMNGIAQEALGKTMSIRTGPAASFSKVGEIAPRNQFEFTEYVEDTNHPGDSEYSWLKLLDGNYTNHIYPPNGLRVTILQEPGEGEPPPSGDEEMIQYKDGVEVRRWIPKS
jgi:hypothetical protein